MKFIVFYQRICLGDKSNIFKKVGRKSSLNRECFREGMQCERSGCVRMMFEKGVFGAIDRVATGILASRNRKDLVQIIAVILVCVIETLHACRRPAAAPFAWSSLLARKIFRDLTRASPTKGTVHWSKHGE
jgi:hypothetical protein